MEVVNMPSIDRAQITREALISENTYLQNIIATLPGCVYWKDSEGVYLGCNNAMLEMVGLSTINDVIGKTDHNFCWHNETAMLRKNDREVMQQGRKDFQETVTLVDGKRRAHTVTKMPLRDEQGNVVGVIGTSLDITALKRAEKLEREKAVAEKTAIRVRALAGTMAHQLSNPLSGIKMFFHFIRDQLPALLRNYRLAIRSGTIEADPPAEVIDAIENSLLTAEQQIHQAEHMMEHQLMNIKENHRHMALDMMNIAHHSITDIVDSMLVKYPFTKAQRSLIHWIKGNDFSIMGEKHLIVNVLNNLISNALESISESGKKKSKIEIWLSGHTVHVKDNGLGLDSGTRKILFEPFYTTHNNGTGLGLYFCQSVMDAHFGDVTTRGRVGQYAHFGLRFPTLAAFKKRQKSSYRKYLGGLFDEER